MANLNIYKKGFTMWGIKWGSVLGVIVLLLLMSNYTIAQDNGVSCAYSNDGISGTKYYENGVYISSSSLGRVSQGTRVKVCFTAPSEASTYTLVSYKAPGPYFNEENAYLQELYDYETKHTMSGEKVCLEIEIPNCFFQVDFVKGCKIDQLGPAGTDNFYGMQGRLITYKTGGNGECAELEGCTLGYWKNHTDRWCAEYTTSMTFGSVFSEAAGSDLGDLTLLEALSAKGGGENNLARQGVAALLNACSSAVPSPYAVETVIYIVNSAIKYHNEGEVAEELDILNNAGCTLGGTRATTSLKNSAESGIIGIGDEDGVSAYPTPFTDKATIKFKAEQTEPYTINLYDMKGNLVSQLKAGPVSEGEVNTVEVDGRNLPEGLYVARLISDSGIRTVKLLRKK